MNSLTLSVLSAVEVVHLDLVVGAEDDEEVVEQVEEEHLRLHLPHLGVGVVQLLVARVDPDLVVERRQVVASHDYEVLPPQLQRTEVLLTNGLVHGTLDVNYEVEIASYGPAAMSIAYDIEYEPADYLASRISMTLIYKKKKEIAFS